MGITFETPIVLSDVDAHGLKLAGNLDPDQLPGVSALVDEARRDAVDGSKAGLAAAISADLHLVPGGKPRHWKLDGEIHASVPLVCQRCLELTAVAVGRKVQLALVASDLDDESLASALPSAERWDHDDETLVVRELIDEWIILELPMVVAHERIEDCGRLAAALERPAGSAQTQKPFEGLASLLADKS